MSSKKHGSTFRNGLRTYRVPVDATSAVVTAFLQSLDCPRALTVDILFRNGEFDQLAKLECDPLHYENVMDFRDAYMASMFLSKYRGFSLDTDLNKEAFEKFEKFESLCKSTNSRFRYLSSCPLYRGPNVWLHNAVIRKIQGILGDFRPEEMFRMADWGPGATTQIKRRNSSPANKFQSETGITRDLYALLSDGSLLEEFYPHWGSYLTMFDVTEKSYRFPSFVVGNKVVTVPKDARSNRVIAIEPGINLWFQLAIGKMISKRLLRYGIDLTDQSKNQRLAKTASIDAVHATVDFSSASDSISKGLIREVLPPSWYLPMDNCRSHHGHLGERLVCWEKFSSMGNGFTFPLESLIFYALAVACMEYEQPSALKNVETVSVYGDDVIVPVRCLDLFSGMCELYGFSMNSRKTHFASTFRESCGAHFMSGFDVKPVYLKDALSTVPSVFRLANGIRRLAHQRNSFLGCDARLLPVWVALRHLVPKELSFWVPFGLGDGGFTSNFDEAAPIRARHSIEGYYVMHVVEASKTRYVDGVGVMLSQLWNASKQPLDISLEVTANTKFSLPSNPNYTPILGRTVIRVARSLVRRWYDLGPWI